MQDSHTPVPADETAADLGPPRLISTAAVGLPQLALALERAIAEEPGLLDLPSVVSA